MAAPKSGLLALLASPKKGGPDSSAPSALGDEGGGDEVGGALREMFDALKGGDDSGAALAFKRAYHACADEGSEPIDDDMSLDDEEEDETDLEM